MAKGYCEEDFFIDTHFVDVKNKVKTLENAKKEEIPKPSYKPEEPQKKSFFSKFKNSENPKQTKYNYATNKYEEIPKGYYGKLPDIEADFKYKNQSANSSSEINAKPPKLGDLEDENLKKAPYDDALFLDVIVKKEKTSTYVNDLQRTKFALQNLKKCLEEKGDIQRYNGCVNLVDLYSKNLKNKYENKSESLKESYIDILNTAYYAKVLGNLMYDANYYARYVPTQSGSYSKENIDFEKNKLLNRVNKTLLLISEEN